jgi:hypothetical protein
VRTLPRHHYAESVVRLSAGREDMSEQTQAFARRRQLDLLRTEAADHVQSRTRSRPRAHGQARHGTDGTLSFLHEKFRTKAKPANNPAIDNNTDADAYNAASPISPRS